MPSVLPLDTICNSATYFVAQWTPELKRNQSRDLLRLILSKMYFPSQGNLFHARIRASDAPDVVERMKAGEFRTVAEAERVLQKVIDRFIAFVPGEDRLLLHAEKTTPQSRRTVGDLSK